MVAELQNWKLLFGEKKLDAEVPGDVMNDLWRAGAVKEPFFADNFKQLGWVHEREWVYECRFDIGAAALASPRVQVVFDGVDTVAEIALNGVLLGKTENMFLRYAFDAKSALRAGENVLTVRFVPLRGVLEQFKNDGKYTSCFHDTRIFLRKAQCHFGWDWAPNFPGLGIWQPVWLRADDGRCVDFVRIAAGEDGAVRVTAELSYNNRKHRKGIPEIAPEQSGEQLFVELLFEGKVIASASAPAFGAKNLFAFSVRGARLWYPNGYGRQPLYACRVTLKDRKSGAVLDTKEEPFAFRTVRAEMPVLEDERIGFGITVNGTRIRAVGSNWVPASILTGCLRRADYDRLLTAARDAGINMLRVWGGGVYEKDEFYRLCDAYGILVWQDFMFSCCDVPDDLPWFNAMAEREATYQLRRLRNHPCIALWCAGNELTGSFRAKITDFGNYVPRVLLPGLCAELDGTRPYLNDSPYSVTDVGNDLTSGDCHVNSLAPATAENNIVNFRRYMWENENAFSSECAVLGMCRLRSFKKFMPADKLWPQNELWEDRLSRNIYDDSVPSFTERITMNVRSVFGGASDIGDFIKKSMLVHAEVLRSEIEYHRALPFNNGIMNWMYNDIWGNATWAIVDYYGEKKPAYFALKRAGRRRACAVVLRREGLVLSLVNDTKEPWAGAAVCGQESEQGALLQSKTFSFSLAPFAQQRIALPFAPKAGGYLFAEAEGAEPCFYYPDLSLCGANASALETEFAATGKNSATLTVTAKQFVRSVFIDAPEAFALQAEDNYFDLRAGAKKTVAITFEGDLTAADVRVLTFADEWVE